MTLQELLEKALEQIKTVGKPKEVPVIKSVEQEERKALFVAMEPDVFDAHGDTTSPREVEKACNNFNKHCMRANLFHRVETDAVEIQQSFILPASIELDTGRVIQKGSWLMWMHFPEDNDTSNQLWDMVKSGDVNGISIGAKAKAENLS